MAKKKEEKKEVTIDVKPVQEVVPKYTWQINESGEYQVSSLTELNSAMSAYRKANLIPKQFDTNEVAIGAYQYCKNLGINPLTNWGQVAHIHGKFSAFGTLFTALAQRDPEFGYDEVVYFNENMDIISLENKNIKDPAFGCRIRTQKKNSPFIMETIFTMDDAKKAGLIKNVWNTYPKDMLRWKCLARNYRTLYPAALNGVQLAEDVMESWDYEARDVNPAQGINARLGLGEAKE